MQSEGLDYEKVSTFVIRFNPGTFVTNPLFLIGYQYKKTLGNITAKPIIETFGINLSSGASNTLTFNFNIKKYSGLNIYWTIIRDGDANKVVGTGSVTNSAMLPTPITDEITVEDSVERAGEEVPYTMVLTYNMPTGEINVTDEKVMASTSYLIIESSPITGVTSILIDDGSNVVSKPRTGTYDVSYSLIIPVDSVPIFDWKLEEYVLATGVTTIIASGNHINTVIADSFTIDFTSVQPEVSDIDYRLSIDELADGVWRSFTKSTFKIRVPSLTVTGRGGWMPGEYYYLDEDKNGITTVPEYEALDLENVVDPIVSIEESDLDANNTIDFTRMVNDQYGEYFYFVELPISITGNDQGDVTFSVNGGIILPNKITKFLLTDGITVAYILTQEVAEANVPVVHCKISK